MIEKKMVTRTIEGFIRQLKKDGHDKYASELRTIIAMSLERKDAVTWLAVMASTLLEHIIKRIAIPQSTSRDKWRREILGYLNDFDVCNENPKGLPWLTVEYIKTSLNDTLSGSKFEKRMRAKLDTYPEKDLNDIMLLLESHKTLESLGIKLLYNSDSDLCISINGQPL